METAIITTSLLLLLLVVFIIFFVFVHKNRQLTYKKEKELLQSQHAQALLQTQLEIQEQTLCTISQEIHDNVGQVLSLAKLNLKTLDFDTGVSKDEKIENTVELVSKAINDLRDLSRSLNGDKIADLGLKDAIDNELKIIQNTGLFHTSLTIEGNPYILQSQHEMVIFRIVQESLNNAVKHSKATKINILINYLPSHCSITVADDGEGFDANQLEATQTGIGLKNMQSRASLINAYFSIQSTPGKGTKVFIESANKTL
jgi:signal transduction histidine kinase